VQQVRKNKLVQYSASSNCLIFAVMFVILSDNETDTYGNADDKGENECSEPRNHIDLCTGIVTLTIHYNALIESCRSLHRH